MASTFHGKTTVSARQTASFLGGIDKRCSKRGPLARGQRSGKNDELSNVHLMSRQDRASVKVSG